MYERSARKPNLETLFAYELVFGAPARELFAGAYQKVEKKISKRAQLLARKVNRATPNSMATRKLQILGVVLKLRARDRPMPGNLKRGQFDLGHVLFVVPQFCPKLRFENLVEGHLQPVEQTRLRPAPSHPLDPVVHLAKGILNGVGGQRYDFAVG